MTKPCGGNIWRSDYCLLLARNQDQLLLAILPISWERLAASDGDAIAIWAGDGGNGASLPRI